jgi:hypothetical protein
MGRYRNAAQLRRARRHSGLSRCRTVVRLYLADDDCAPCACGCSVAPASRYAPLVAGAILLVLFVPVHIQIGARLPLWYHLFFLVTLVPFVLLGARLKARA